MAGRRFLVPLSIAILGALPGADLSGMVRADAIGRLTSKSDDEDEQPALLLHSPQEGALLLAGHRSHRSHSSHRSHHSGRSWGGWGLGSGGGDDDDYEPQGAAARPQPPAPARPYNVSFVAIPGGRIFVDDVELGRDETRVVTLRAGSHAVRVENRFLGVHSRTIELGEGTAGVIRIVW